MNHDHDSDDSDHDMPFPINVELFNETEEEIQRRKRAENVAQIISKRSEWASLSNGFYQFRHLPSPLKLHQVIGNQQQMVWPCAIVLSRVLEKQQYLVENQRVIELGCGMGLPGMVAARLGAKKVALTERESAINHIENHLVENFATNPEDRNIFACGLDWDKPEQGLSLLKSVLPFEVVLCSDLVYAGDSITTELLVEVVLKVTKGCERVRVISCYEIRAIGGIVNDTPLQSQVQAELFAERLKSHGFVMRLDQIEFDSIAVDPFITLCIFERII